MFVYLITNIVNGMRYVGACSCTPRRRFLGHVANASKGTKTDLYDAMREYGPGAFYVETLAEFATREEGFEAEKAKIAELGTLAPAGYNMMPGGVGRKGPFRPETIERLSTSIQSAWDEVTPERRAERGAAISAGLAAAKAAGKIRKKREDYSVIRGIERSPEFREKVSAGMKARVAALPPGEMARRASLRKRGPTGSRTMTEEERAKRSESARLAAIKRYADPEQRRLTAERTRAQHARRKEQ